MRERERERERGRKTDYKIRGGLMLISPGELAARDESKL